MNNASVHQLKTPLNPAPMPADNIILIASGKGGVGKTWFSISLAHTLAALHKKVLVFDGDIGLANIDIQLGLQPEKDLGHVMEGSCDFKNAIMSYNPGNHQAGFDILAGRSGSGTLSDLSHERLTLIREELKAQSNNYDYVLIDLGAGIGGIVKSLTPAAATCILVINDEPTSLTDAYAFLKVTRRNHPHLDIKILVNTAESIHQGDLTYQGFKNVCEKFLKYTPKLAGVIRRDSHVKDAIRHQTALATRHPNSNALKDVKNVASRLT